MELQEALGFLRRLADGVDPRTGEIYPADSPYQQPQVIRALYIAIEHLEEVHRLLARGNNLPPRIGVRWTKAESDKLLNSYNRGTTIKDIATQHQRTSGAIRSQLQKLGLTLETLNLLRKQDGQGIKK